MKRAGGIRGAGKAAAADQRATALIIAGGRGTRFWPESRAGRPKPLFALDGRTSLLSDTIARLRPLIAAERIFVLASADQRAPFRKALRGLLPAENLIVEPEGRGTAVAIAYGVAAIVRRRGEDTAVAVTPADHYVTPAEGFRATIAEALGLARAHEAIVVVGVTPTSAETGYGYQQIGPAVGTGFKVARFVEKPAPAVARRMVKSGRYLWNAGMFVMRAGVLAAELRRHAPALAAAMERFGAIGARELPRYYRGLEFASFDRELAEKSRNVLGVRARFNWFDVGSWQGLWAALRPADGANVLSGNVIALGANGVLARGGKRLMVLLGVDDLAVVDAGDAILIARLSASQEIRRVTEELARRGLNRYL